MTRPALRALPILALLVTIALPATGCGAHLSGMDFREADGIVRAPLSPERPLRSPKLDPVANAKTR